MRSKTLGNFKVVSGKVTVSDPCYEKSIKDYGKTFTAYNGEWTAVIYFNGDGRVSSLVAVNKKEQHRHDSEHWYFAGRLGVDSGQMSIFDNKFYRAASEGKNQPKADFIEKKMEKDNYDWYAAICNLTTSSNNEERGGGVLAHGCVSSSGYGDGYYTCECKNDNKGKVVAVRVRFD